MLVYRVENQDQVGAYQMFDITDNYVIESPISEQHPDPGVDTFFRNFFICDYHFSFRNLDDLHTWFDEELKELLRAAGALISVYDAYECQHGHKQSIFKLKTAQLLERLPL